MAFIFRSSPFSIPKLQGRTPRLRSNPSEIGSGHCSCHCWSQEQRRHVSDRSAQGRDRADPQPFADHQLDAPTPVSVGALLAGTVFIDDREDFARLSARSRSSWWQIGVGTGRGRIRPAKTGVVVIEGGTEPSRTDAGGATGVSSEKTSAPSM